MRNLLCAALIGLGLALTAAPAQAQGVTNFFPAGAHAATFSSGAAQTVVNQPVDTSLAIAPFPTQQQGASYLPSFFHNMHIPGFPSSPGTSPLPPPSSFPSTSYPNFKPVPFVPVNQESRHFLPFFHSSD